MISNFNLQGKLRGKENELEYCRLLGTSDVVNQSGADATYSVGRKWRSALTKLGFLYPKLPKGQEAEQDQLGPSDHITEAGERLLAAESVPAWQECFLRGLLAYRIGVDDEHQAQFSPLAFVLTIMSELERRNGSSVIHFIEMATVIQVAQPEEGIGKIADRLMQLRSLREAAERKRRFDVARYEEIAKSCKKVPGTLRDYADTNFRYLKATGLVQSKGRGITFMPAKRKLIEQIVTTKSSEEESLQVWQSLASGAVLPTDNIVNALAVVEDLAEQYQSRGNEFDLAKYDFAEPADVALVRHDLEGKIFQLDEEDYASSQSTRIVEIAAYLDLLTSKKVKAVLGDGTEISIPRGEAPAYFEWAMWRAFLAINSLVNPPWESRRFKIDQDFLPVGTAPGRGSDAIFEFDDFVIVLEVTLTTSSRQEAAEGETVRRHVAQYVEEYSARRKKVLGLFVAVAIDTNTANTFRLGEWHLADDTKIFLEIVPMRLEHFRALLLSSEGNPRALVQTLKTLLHQCREAAAVYAAPQWKESITELVGKAIR